MGKGDKKSNKGKIWRKSYGNARKKTAIKSRLKRKLFNRSASANASSEAAAAEAKPKVKRTTKKKAEAGE